MIKPDMYVKELMAKYPKARPIIARYGLTSIGCG